MKQIKYGLDVYILSDETFKNLMQEFNNGVDRVYVKEVDAVLSKNFSYAGRPPISQDELKKTYLGGREVINKFGKWYFADDPDKYLDPDYFDFRDIKTKDQIMEEKEYLALEDKTKKLN